MYKILSTRHNITDEFWCIRFFHFIHNVVLLSIYLDSIRVHACLLYRKEWKIIELVMKLCGCYDITINEEFVFVKCVE